MRTLATTALFAATIAVAGITATPAEAACTRLGFSVNDYGKDGPIKDAKGLLDKYIARWASERGIKSYRTGPKSVNCELFLDLIVFDEHTCRAEATVCWDGPPVAPAVKADGEPGVTTSPEKKAPANKAKDPAATSTVKRAAAPVTPAPRAAKPASETVVPVAATPPAKPDPAAIYIAPAAKPATAANAPAAAPVPPRVEPRVETGTIPADRAPAAAAAPKAAESGDAALLAAQRAAAAAERAAAAAERAAAAAAAAEKASGRQ